MRLYADSFEVTMKENRFRQEKAEILIILYVKAYTKKNWCNNDVMC